MIVAMIKKRRSPKAYFVVCVRNDGYPASLERRQIYRAIADNSAARENLLRVVDESGEDYLYPAQFFVAISLPTTIEHALRKAG